MRARREVRHGREGAREVRREREEEERESVGLGFSHSGHSRFFRALVKGNPALDNWDLGKKVRGREC